MSGNRNRWLFLLFAVAVPAASRAQQNDPQFEAAIAARDAGNMSRAIDLFEQIDAQNPNDPSTLRLLGSAYAARGEHSRAITVLERARMLAPLDRDIALALGRAILWSGRLDEAEATANEIAGTDPDNIELAELRRSIDSARNASHRRPRVTLGYVTSWVEIGNADRRWNAAIIALDAPIGFRSILAGEIDIEDRAGTTDTRLSGRVDRKLAPGKSIFLAGSVTPDPAFREDWGIRAGGEASIDKNVVLTATIRHAVYASSNVTVVEPGVRFQTTNGSASIALHSINLWGEGNDYRNGWSVRGDSEIWRTWRLSAGAATYPDTEAGQTRRVRSLFGAVTVPLSERLDLRVGAEFEERITSYRRTGVSLSLTRRLGP